MISFEQTVLALKAAAEPTRLRILALLAASEHNVKDLSHVLMQSQPRISRHLKLLVDAGLVERFREGSWVYLRLADRSEAGALAADVMTRLAKDDAVLRRDRDRAQALLAERSAAAQAYFALHAAEWDRIRARHVDEATVETAIREVMAGAGQHYDLLVDLGTGTGRILELLADRMTRGVGIDANHVMLTHARAKLDASEAGHIQIRHGDLYSLPMPDGCANAVVMHQVLHFLAEPAQALREAGRILAPGGVLLIVDFAPHEHEQLREAFAHQRLGFANEQLSTWLGESGLRIEGERNLAPLTASGDGIALTVSLWVCRCDPARAVAANEGPAATPDTPGKADAANFTGPVAAGGNKTPDAALHAAIETLEDVK